MPEKDSEDSFYYLNAYQDDITPGQKMTILHNISFNDWRAGPHIAPLVTLTREEVTQRKEASITLEKELYAQLKKLAAAWDEQAAQTMLLERALEYLQTPEVEHTSNEWKQDKNGIWEISNRTYKMRYKISYEKAADVYLVSWGIIYNAPKQPDSNYRNYWGDSIYVARQDIMGSIGGMSAASVTLPQEIADAIEEVGFFQSVPLWMVTFLGSLFITVLSFILIMTVYGRFFRLYMFTALAPLPLASFAGEDTSFMGKAFLKSYIGVCMEGAVVVLACLIFSAFASSGAPIVDASLPVVTMSWQYVAQTIFNMLILVALIKGAERIAKEMFGL